MKFFLRPLPIIFILFFSFIFIAHAQEGTIRGHVKDAKTNEALPGVAVVADDGTGTATDPDGNYEIITGKQKVTLKFRFLGYKENVRMVDVKPGETVTVNINLAEDVAQIDVVVVTGSKFAKKLSEETVSIEVLKQEVIQNSNSLDLEEAMQKVPGVTIVEGQANIRGGSGWSYGAGSRVLVLVDDLPLMSADAADAKWSIAPLENIEQVEVIKGAASAIYGSSALNGIINVRTAWPKQEPFTKVILYHGIYGNPKGVEKWWGKNRPMFGGGSFAHRQKFGQLDLVLGGNFSADKSYLMDNNVQSGRVSFKTRYRPKSIEGLSFGLNANIYASSGTLFFLWSGADSLNYIPFANTSTDYNSYRYVVDPHLTYFDKNENQYSLKLRYFNATNTNDTEQGSTPQLYFGEFQYSRHFTPVNLNFVAGISGYYSDVSSPTGKAEESLIGEHTGSNLSGFIQADKKLFDRLTIAAGVRYEYFRIDTFESDAKPVFRFGVNYHLGEATFFRASFGQGYRFPTMAEKFISTKVGPLNIFPNPGLESETGWSAEIAVKQGVQIDKWRGFVDLAGFVNQYKNMMEFTFGRWGTSFAKEDLYGLGFASQNIGDTRIIGGELTIVGEGAIASFPVTVLAGYTFIAPKSLNWDDTLYFYNSNGDIALTTTYAESTSHNENFLKYRSAHTLKGDVEIQIKKFSIGISLRYNSFMEAIDQTFVDFGELPLYVDALGNGYLAFKEIKDFRDRHNKGDVVMDGRVAYKIKEHARVSLIVKNILNQVYTVRPGFPEAPVNFTFQFAYEF